MTTYYSDSFDADAVGALPTGWANSPVVGASDFKVGNVDAISPARSFGDTAPANLNAAFLTLGTPRADMDVVFTFKARVSGSDYNFHTPILRSDGLDTSDYRVAMNATIVGWYQRTGAGYTQLATATRPAFVNGSRYYCRARVQGTALKVRFWRFGIVEPSTWNLEIPNGAVTAAGGAGIHVGAGGTIPSAAVDDFLVESPNDTPIPAADPVGPLVEPPIEWLDVSAIVGKSDGDNVSHTDLTDQSGNGANPTASNGGTYRVNALGSQAGIEMDGTNDNYTGAAVIPTSGNYTKVVVVIPTNTAAVSYLSGGNLGHSLYLNSTNKPRLYQAGDALISGIAATQDAGALIVGAVTDVVGSLDENASFGLSVNGLWGGISGYAERAKVNLDPVNYIGAQAGTAGSRFKFFERLIYAAALGGGEVNQIIAYCNTKYGLSIPLHDMSLLLDGDSLTIDQETTAGNGWVFKLAAALTSAYTLRYAVRGRTLAELAADAPANIDFRLVPHINKTVYMPWIGVNDLRSGATGANAYIAYAAILEDRKAAALAAGVTHRNIAVKITPSGASAGVEAQRIIFNGLIDGNTLTTPDAVVGDDPLLWAPGAQNNATYFNADLLHLTDAGAALFATEAQAKIEGLDWPATGGGGGSHDGGPGTVPGINTGPFRHDAFNPRMWNAMHNVGGMPIEGG